MDGDTAGGVESPCCYDRRALLLRRSVRSAKKGAKGNAHVGYDFLLDNQQMRAVPVTWLYNRALHVEFLGGIHRALHAPMPGPTREAVSIVRSMRTARGWEHRQLSSIRVLTTLARGGAEGCQSVFLAGGIRAALDAMRRHRASSDVQVEAAQFMALVAQCGGELREQVVQAGGLEALAAALKSHAPSSLQAAAALAEDAKAEAQGTTVGVPGRFLHAVRPMLAGRLASRFRLRVPVPPHGLSVGDIVYSGDDVRPCRVQRIGFDRFADEVHVVSLGAKMSGRWVHHRFCYRLEVGDSLIAMKKVPDVSARPHVLPRGVLCIFNGLGEKGRVQLSLEVPTEGGRTSAAVHFKDMRHMTLA